MLEKTVLKSKTFYLGLVTALAPLLPGVGAWVADNVATVGLVWGGLTVLLRLVTKDKVTLVP